MINSNDPIETKGAYRSVEYNDRNSIFPLRFSIFSLISAIALEDNSIADTLLPLQMDLPKLIVIRLEFICEKNEQLT